jgi:hypothetical protein
MCTSKDVTSFLEQVDHNNASHILYRLSPIPLSGPTYVTLEDDSVPILTKIQSDCTGLVTVTTSLYSTDAIEVRLDRLDHPKTAAEPLALVDARFRAISSLQEIIVEVYEDA